MEVIVVDKDEYIRFNARLIDKMHTFNLSEDTKNYIIYRVKLGKQFQDVSLMNSCINNLLDEQFEKKEYIKIEDIQAVEDLIINLNKEQCHILNAYAEVQNYTIKDLNEVKELITNINDYQILEKYDLHEIGVLIAQKVSGYRMGIEVIPFVNFTELAERYLFDANIKENFCSYGLLINTRKMLDNELVQPKVERDKIFKIELVNKKEFEESRMYSRVTIYLPSSQEVIEEKIKLINLDYNKLSIQDTHVTKCELINFRNNELENRFNKMMEQQIEIYSTTEGNTTPFQEIEFLCDKIKKFDNLQMSKFLALIQWKQSELKYIHDIVQCAVDIEDYKLLPDIKNLTDMGKYLVNETGHFDEVSYLEDYIDYYKLGSDYTKNGCAYSGKFTEYGYIMQNTHYEKNKGNENVKEDSLLREEEEEILEYGIESNEEELEE